MAREFQTIEEIQQILSRGAFQELIGALENEFFEAKSEPWDLETERGQLNMAKDISSLANLRGGVIVIGAVAHEADTYQRNEIQEIHPLPISLTPSDRYQHVLREWVYPVPQVEFRWHEDPTDPGRGIIGVNVRDQSPDLRPFLVAHQVGETGRKIEYCVWTFPAFRRHSTAYVDRGTAFAPEGRSSSGRNSSEVGHYHCKARNRRSRGFETMNEQLLSDASVMDRLEAAIELAQLTEQSVFALTAKPSPDARFRSLFAGNDAPLVKNFNHPPNLRRAGFDLEHRGDSRIVVGELRRALAPTWKVMELWRDGCLLYAVDAMVQPCWGKPTPDGALRVNPLALCEPVYLFAKLSKLIFQDSIRKPERIEYGVRFERLTQNGKPARLSEGPLGPFFRSEPGHPAPAPDMQRVIVWDRQELDEGAVAYEIVQEVYRWF